MRIRVRAFRCGVSTACVILSTLAAISSLSVDWAAASLPNAFQTAAFTSAVRRTIEASSFTMHLPGAVFTYQVPNRTSVQSLNQDYLATGYYAGGRTNAVIYLDLALRLTITGVHGVTYDVQGVVTGPPKFVQTLLYPPYPLKGEGTCPSSPTTACSSLTPTYFFSSRHYVVTGEVRVKDGYVASETFQVRHFVGPKDGFGGTSGTVTYSGINTSHA